MSPARDRWLELGADLRSSVDLFEFLGPQFNETYRARARKRGAEARGRAGPHAARQRARWHGGRSPAASSWPSARVPTNAEIER